MGISGAGNEPDNMQSSPKSPESFIEIRYHPHSGNLNTTIIPLNNPQEKEPGSNTGCVLSSITKPWAPFRTRANFEFAEDMVKSGLHSESIKKLLEGFNGRWATQTLISMKNFADFQDSLAAARHFSVQYHFTFKYRDPWRWLLDIVTDPTLSQSIIWYPEEKYLHQGSRITRIYDELNSGTRWWEIQDTLSHEFGMPHVYLPLHLWLDKSSVAQTVTKHPIVLRPGFLPSTIRNGSGNGGGALIGYMVVVGDPNDDADNEDEKLDSVEYAQFKREVYHEICKTIFKSLRCRSHKGEAVTCGDNIARILHPGFMIDAIDGEEGYCLCCTRGAKANHPCARCLAHRDELHMLSQSFELRTQESMIAIYKKASTLPTTACQSLLRDHGLHFIENAFWGIANSDPYLAYSYDMLHSLDSGEWGKHQWPLIHNILTSPQQSELNRNMRQVPRWRGLKHFNAVVAVDFSDGNSYRDILKCILPCIVNILPRNSTIVQAIRLCAIIREIASLNPVTEEHIEYLERCLPRYQKICSQLSLQFGKNYNYPKHHNLVHLPEDLRAKGSTVNYTTRPGEGFQQEVQQAYDQTNFKNTEPQMTQIDENQEAIARIRTAVDLHDEYLTRAIEEQNRTDGGECPVPTVSETHWSLGSPLRMIPAKKYEKEHVGQPGFRFFERNLHDFLHHNIPLQERPSEPLQIVPYQCLYLRYRSLENWQEKQDILRCNAEF
ncbi:hypothetical protein M422DRAFT_188008, partial [Sphaerobolus stellatus SS14]